MPRTKRLFLPSKPQHLVLRGHSKSAVFVRDADFLHFTECLLSASRRYGTSIHAWVLMNNHFHLLLSTAAPQALPRTLQSLGRTYARYFNRCHHRSGALWEGRYKTSWIETDTYLLACYRYIELNPVRAAIVAAPQEWRWSSYHANALGARDPLITPHALYLALAADPQQRLHRYKALFDNDVDMRAQVLFRRGISKGTPVGTPEYVTRIAAM